MKKYMLFIVAVFLLIGVSPAIGRTSGFATEPAAKSSVLDIRANITFFYYKDLAAAVEFYEHTMGFERVLDYGFARAFQISSTAFLCLVDETKGMHKTTEPKSATLSFITRQVDGWHDYLKAQGVKLRSAVRNSKRLPIRGFVAYDPEGYFLEFETFLDHDQNKKLLPILAETSTLYPPNNPGGARPKELGFQGNILWMYYKDVPAAQRFYQDNMGLKMLVDQGYAKLYTSSPSGFVGLVDEAKGLHRFASQKAVNVGFITSKVDQWYDHLLKKGLKMRGPVGNAEKGRVRAFVTFDCGGYYLEFDTFLPNESNKALLKILNRHAAGPAMQ